MNQQFSPQLLAMLLRQQQPNAMNMAMMQGGLLGPMQMPQGQMPMGGLLGFGDRMPMPPIYQPPSTSGTRG